MINLARLSDRQIYTMQCRILRRLTADIPGVDTEEKRREFIGEYKSSGFNFLRVWSSSIQSIEGGPGVIAQHESAARAIESIQRFYSMVTPDEIEILNWYVDPAAVELFQTMPEEAPVLRPGFVYLLKEINGQHHKIGKAKDPKDRIKTFNVKLPYKVEFNCLIPSENMDELEAAFHRYFADKRVDGEWFLLSDDDVNFFRSVGGVRIWD